LENIFNIDIPIVINEDSQPPNGELIFYMSRGLIFEEEQYIERVILSWYIMGIHRGLSEYKLHYMSDPVFDDDNTISFQIDFGGCSIKVLNSLFTVLKDSLEIYDVRLIKIELI
jgi:hypothetical protein